MSRVPGCRKHILLNLSTIGAITSKRLIWRGSSAIGMRWLVLEIVHSAWTILHATLLSDLYLLKGMLMWGSGRARLNYQRNPMMYRMSRRMRWAGCCVCYGNESKGKQLKGPKEAKLYPKSRAISHVSHE